MEKVDVMELLNFAGRDLLLTEIKKVFKEDEPSTDSKTFEEK